MFMLLISSKLSEDSISDKTSVTQVIPFQARNYYKSVSENKEITKLLSVLSSSISSSKKVYNTLYNSIRRNEPDLSQCHLFKL